MPQLTLEYSCNIIDDVNFNSLLKKLHEVVSEEGNINITNFKSRVVKHENFLVGAGNQADAFVHVEFKLLEGRSEELKSKIGNLILDTIKKYYPQSVEKLDLQITVELLDIKKSDYYKYPNNL